MVDWPFPMIVEPVVFRKLSSLRKTTGSTIMGNGQSTIRHLTANSVVLYLVGGSDPHKLHTCIHQVLCSCKKSVLCFLQIRNICI